MSLEFRPADAPLEQAMFEGKRRAARKRRTLAIECRGPDGLRVEARTVDVSRGGTLIEITDPDIFSTDRSAPFAGRAREIEALFSKGINVSFGEGAVLAFARIIRHIVDADHPEKVLLGCNFAPELTPVDCRLLGIDFESTEAVESDDVDGEVRSPLIRREGDELVAFIAMPDRPWSTPEGPTDSSPVPALDAISLLRADIVYDGSDRATGSVLPTAETISDIRVTGEVTAPAPAFVASGEGLTDEDLRRMGRERLKATGAAVAGRASDWAGTGRVAVYLFPSMAGALAPRYHGRLEAFGDGQVVVDLPVPASDSDAVGHGAGLGEIVRAVFVRDGHVLGETNCRVMRLTEYGTGVLRTTLAPSQQPSDSLRGALSRT